MTRFFLSGLFILLLNGSILFGQESVEFPQKLDQKGFRGIIAKSGNLYISGQPDDSSFSWLKQQGVRTIINLRTDQEMNNRDYVPFDEKALLENLGLSYIHIPLGGENNPYTPQALNTFAESIDKAEGKVLLHCTVAWRASHMWAAYLVKYKGFSTEKAIEYAKAINFGELPIEGLLGNKVKIILE
ncbi:MAG: dual specificity protein phosphatase family protein [Calditrichae bacterium]|nr:dual specificity protein phosphatase family protein [Calditrichia bacterium]